MPTGNTLNLPALPQFPPDGKEFFNAVMVQLEPDLTTENVGALKVRYANETPEEHALRMERYRTALAEYQKKSEQYFVYYGEQARKFGKELDAGMEADVREVEEGRLKELEDMFS